MAAAIIMGIAGIGFGLMGEANAQANSDRAVEAQHEAAMAQWRFNEKDRDDMYYYEGATVEIARENDSRARAYQDAVNLREYNITTQTRLDDYNAKKDAYKQSIEDYDNQVNLNTQIADFAKAENEQKLFDQQTALDFTRQENNLSQLAAYNQLTSRLGASQNAVTDALMQEQIQETVALRDRNQAYDNANLQLDRLDTLAAEANSQSQLENERLQEQVNASRISRDMQLSKIRQGQDTDELTTNQSIEQAELQRDQRIDSLKMSNTKDNLSFDQKLEVVADTFGDTQEEINQTLGELTDQQRYNLFESDVSLGNLGFELTNAKLQYQQQRAAQSFEQQSNRIEDLQRTGMEAAKGRKGLSAAKTLNSTLALAGRRNAQLTDSILRADVAYRSKDSDIRRRIQNEAIKSALQADTLTRKQANQLSDLERARQDRDRDISQTGSQRKLADAESTLSISQATGSAAQATKTLRDSKNLRDRQAVETSTYINNQFNQQVDALNVEQKLLAENLKKTLSQYSFESGSLDLQKRHATENYNVAYMAAQEVHDSAMRQYDRTFEDVENERSRLETQGQMFSDQYDASLLSAQKAKEAADQQVDIDSLAASLTAEKIIMVEPVEPEPLPAPIKMPVTVFQDPRKPLDLPKPKEGIPYSGNFMGAIGSGLTNLAGIAASLN